MKNKIRFLLVGILLLLLAAFFVLWYAAENILPYSAIKPSRASVNFHAKIRNDIAEGRLDTISVQVDSAITLKGWVRSPATGRTKALILLFHGIADSKLSFYGFMDSLSMHGYRVAAFDHRAHGESTGDYCTFGYFEKHDYSVVLDTLLSKYDDTGKIYVSGRSLGAAIAIQFMESDSRVSAGIFESCFTGLRRIIYDYFRRMSVIPLDFAADIALKKAEVIAGFKVDSVMPVISISKITRPVLLIHGTADDRIKAEYGKQLYDACASGQKFWYPVQNADHNNVPLIGGLEYYNRVYRFFERTDSLQVK